MFLDIQDGYHYFKYTAIFFRSFIHTERRTKRVSGAREARLDIQKVRAYTKDCSCFAWKVYSKYAKSNCNQFQNRSNFRRHIFSRKTGGAKRYLQIGNLSTLNLPFFP